MDQDRWKEVNRIFHAALSVSVSERHDFVVSSAHGDEDIQAEVELLLRADQSARSYLETPLLKTQLFSSESALLHPGDELCGRFRVLREIAEGGMGQVFEAFDSELGVHVALKLIRPEIASDARALTRFRHEVRLAREIAHPNVCRTFDIEHTTLAADSSSSATREIVFLTMEFLPGETLACRISHAGAMPIELALPIARQLAGGIQAAHSLGIAHRDLKPGNVMLVPSGSESEIRAVITDFGLARFAPLTSSGDASTVSPFPGQLVGTLAYMSPEQLEGQPVSTATDIYSFGLILFELVTGKRAFPSEKLLDSLSQRLTGPVPSPKQYVPNLPRSWCTAIEKCLDPQPIERPKAATDVVHMLDRGPSNEDRFITTVEQIDAETKSQPDIRQQTVEAQQPRKWLLAAIPVLLIGLFVAWWRMLPAVPVVEPVVQLTNDGQPKGGQMVSDGSRIYFNEGPYTSQKIAQVSVTGGPTVPVETTFGTSFVESITYDGSALLVVVPDGAPGAGSPWFAWSVSLPGAEPRRFSGLETENVDAFPDGRIAFSQFFEGKDPKGTDRRTDYFIADKDGLNHRKLVSFPGFDGSLNVSPDGQRVVLTRELDSDRRLFEIAADGTGLREIRKLDNERAFRWTPDEKYVVYQAGNGLKSDIWLLPMKSGPIRRSNRPIRLTNGPIPYSNPYPSRDGKQIFVLGVTERGELVRYDMKSHQFVPFLSGISATDPTFSRDGKWVAYSSYPDHTLWRSRSDGTERMQLTYPPMDVNFPVISPDGTRVSFQAGGLGSDLFVISMNGGEPQKVADIGWGASWSPDGNQLAYTDSLVPFRTPIMDLRTRRVVPAPKDFGGSFWLTQDILVARDAKYNNFVTTNLKSQQIKDLAPKPLGDIESWMLSPDAKYIYFTTRGADSKVMRLRVADRQLETITSLKDLHRVANGVGNNKFTQINVGPDGSPIFTSDTGYQEIYALNIRWP